MRNRTIFRRGIAAVAALALAGTLASCAQSQRETDSSSEQSTSQDFVFAASSDPVMLDPAMASDGETFRIARQQFEGLISTKPGTTELEPLLATEWKASSDGKSFTFTLREGVKFSDGTDFNAEAVCANFERWYNWTGVNQSENISYYYGKLFRGFKTGKTGGIYDGCTAVSPTEVTIKLNRPFAAFVDAMTLPAFSMQSPTALKQYNADDTSGTADDPRFSAYATEHPTGTGPFVFEKWERNQQVTLKRNDNYWGDKAKADRVIIRTISDPKARTQELQAGNIDGYDLVGPADVQPLKDAGFQIQNRPAFNILYLGMNQKNKALAKIKVREAIAHAIDKQAVVKSSLPDGSITATQFMPDLVEGYNDQIKDPDYNVDEAKKLLAEAGESDLVLKFAYPTGVSRPYMPSPEDTFAVIKSQLEKAGIKITPVAAKWSPDYLDMIQGDAGTSKHDIHLLGWTGDYNDPDNFVGVFFGGKSSEWGFDNPELFKALADARELPTREQQVPAYKQINADIAEFVPGIPLAHPAPSLAFAKGVQGYVASPVQDEVWNNVTVTR
ncbi:ABC transporter substrate-binding protein [Microlunatus phosphovorus]|uniref:ABC transporter substrate-binding protein n=1 Tax=Microlunatus phosphovorus TaxID=29405 RepID=UPI0002D36468|nr:ABC transporter substrate-binding protein [Microlunatus phosphovorus]